ncbi:MAG: sugar transferase [Acidobacteriota bacterium]
MAAPSIPLSSALPRSSTHSPRLLERAAAALALVAVSPVLAGLMGTVRVLSRRAPLVAHRRVGQFGETLWVFKIRTMWSAHDPSGSGWVEYLSDPVVPDVKDGNDARVTSRMAAFCRRHSLDELPQLAHVVAGSMQWVGPRPMTQREIDEHYAGVREEVLSSAPGLTGLWQVMGRNRLTYPQRRRLDLFLMRRFGWRLCARILLRTVREVVHPRNAW